MIKHFEQLYEESEKLSEKYDGEVFSEISSIIKIWQNEGCSQKEFGKVLFLLCRISHKNNYNAYEALENAMDEFRAEIMDE